jgi:hypothetical protein
MFLRAAVWQKILNSCDKSFAITTLNNCMSSHLNILSPHVAKGYKIEQPWSRILPRVSQIGCRNTYVCQEFLPVFCPFQRSINMTCCSSEDKFITEDTMAKVLQFIQKVCLHINKFVYVRVRKCERKIEIGN